MRKLLSVCALTCFCSLTVADGGLEKLEELQPDEELQQLGEPYKNISGAYYGFGLGTSIISHRVKAWNTTGGETPKRTANQLETSLIGGFGAAFYKRYYSGLELEFFKRFSGGGKKDGSIGVAHPSSMGINMDVRLGYLFPEQGNLLYMTVGFARIIGHARFGNGSRTLPGGRVVNDDKKYINRSFGSFYPTVGCGFEHKVDHNWNVRLDARYSITYKDDGKVVRVNGDTWNYEGKPSRISLRCSVVRCL